MDGTLKQLYLSNYLISEEIPQKSFFTHSYENYENFARDTRRIFANNNEIGRTLTIELDKNAIKGDLISDMTLKLTIPQIEDANNVGYCNGVGIALVEYVELIIAGNIIERYTTQFADLITSLNYNYGKYAKYGDMVKKYNRSNYYFDNFQGGQLFIPLHLWFCLFNNPFPLCAMYESAIKLNIKLRPFEDIVSFKNDIIVPLTQNNKILSNVELLVDYIILMPKIREAMLIRDMERYNLITQSQCIEISVEQNTSNKNVSLKPLKYPVSELIWMYKSDQATTNNDYFNYGDGLGDDAINPVVNCKLIFETGDRTETHNVNVFNSLEKFKFYECNQSNQNNLSFINAFSFAKYPVNLAQPSGICNFSKLQESTLQLEFISQLNAGTLFIFVINYNILKIKNGVAQLLHNLSKATPDTYIKPPTRGNNRN